jgi:hypothetical protein
VELNHFFIIQNGIDIGAANRIPLYLADFLY